MLLLIAGVMLAGAVWGAEPDRPPLLSSPQVVPYNRNDRTNYVFKVRYTSPDRILPQVIKVVVDDKEYPLSGGRKGGYDGWYTSPKIRLETGPHKYYFHAEDGRGLSFRSPRYGAWDGPYVGRSWRKSYNTYPELTGGHLVQGEAGDVETYFTYSVHFRDYDSTPAKKVKVIIDGLPHEMNLLRGSRHNGTFIYNTYHDTMPHAFYFVAEDANGARVSYPTEGFLYGPAVADVPNTSPELTDSHVDPIIGGMNNKYTFSTRYWDAEQDPPAIIQVYVDGYPHNLKLTHGQRCNGVYTCQVKLAISKFHTFYFRAEDGRGGEVTDPIQGIIHGPVVVNQ